SRPDDHRSVVMMDVRDQPTAEFGTLARLNRVVEYPGTIDALKHFWKKRHRPVIAADHAVRRNIMAAEMDARPDTLDIDQGVVDRDEEQRNVESGSPCLLEHIKLARVGKYGFEGKAAPSGDRVRATRISDGLRFPG